MNLVDLSLIITLLAVLAGAFFFIKYRRVKATNDALQNEQAAIREKYGPILDLDAELATRTEELNAQTGKRDELVAAYGHDYETHERLKAEVALLEENLEDISFGIYKPHYSFDAPEDYRKALEDIWQKKKEMVKAGQAAICETRWMVGDSTVKGERMTKQNIKVMLRAFNGEADAAVAKVSWNNVTTMEERIRRAFSAINSMGTANTIRIVPEYLELSLAELRLTYEHEKKKREVLEEQREIRERMREEERAQREFERAQLEAATEQERYEKALARARAEVEKAKGEEIEAANQRVLDLEAKLAEAQAKAERAKSMAEQTRRGYIYVISNIGSFGETVFKIGMTRRLDPLDRVRELGGASVPFQFDVHAMIYSEDAPSFEKNLHRKFADRSVNLVNMRKEFFDLHLDEIESFTKSQGMTMEFTKLAEAREFRETLALRQKVALAAKAGEEKPETQGEFPATLTRS